MPAPESILKLVETFATHEEHYKSSDYNETEVRREFLDPFWKALGWDIDNEQGYADAYKDVIHEDAIKIGGYTKAPDYCFRIGGTRKFFLEAKKPSVDIKGDTHPAYQLRRYAWSGKLPLSVLSDFEEFSVYDCRTQPKPSDRAANSRTFYCTYQEYEARWDVIAEIFSREAVLKGSFDCYADSTRKKKGTTEVDDAFLLEIERWRELIARNFALRNRQLSVRDLNYAVQKTIDRLIFLRICEDRGTEDYGRLRKLENGTNCYPRLLEEFSRADDRYNSGLFHFGGEKDRAGAPDRLTPSLSLDDKIVKDIVKNLYYPESPYEFSVLPADILGQVYEQFLGKTIRLTDGHQAKIEEKPEVRKAGGVYYTPKYIVDYIVENTLGRLLNGAEPDKKRPIPVSQAEKLKIVDPACGSGSFLIVAYQYLLDWHRDQYTLDADSLEEDEGKIKRHAGGKTPKIYQAPGGEWKLTTTERKRILLANIHGVDIDAQAVEVTKLSLLLKVLEGETQQQLQRDFLKERQRILPDLGANVRCGNSLIGSDFYDQPDLVELDDETRFRINVFDWEEAFPQVFAQGGFDCVIGNPPYVFGEFIGNSTKKYLKNSFPASAGQMDYFQLFLELSIKIVCKGGSVSMIIPDSILARPGGSRVRDHLFSFGIDRLFHCGLVFPGVAVSAAIIVARNTTTENVTVDDFVCGQIAPVRSILKDRMARDNQTRFLLHASDEESVLIDRLSALTSMSSFGTLSRGEEAGRKHLLPRGSGGSPILKGSDISRYALSDPTEEISIVSKSMDLYSIKKIVIVKTGSTCVASYDPGFLVTLQSVYNYCPSTNNLDLRYILGCINCQLSKWWLFKTFTAYKKLFPQLNQSTIDSIPIVPIDFDDPSDAAQHDKMVSLVERMLELHKRRAEEMNPETLRHLETEITTTDRRIDRLVYELYELTEDEISLVEERD